MEYSRDDPRFEPVVAGNNRTPKCGSLKTLSVFAVPMPRSDVMVCPDDPKEQMRTVHFSLGPGRGKVGVKKNAWVYYCPKHKIMVIYGVKWY